MDRSKFRTPAAAVVETFYLSSVIIHKKYYVTQFSGKGSINKTKCQMLNISETFALF